jgi:hypothetical protein
MGGLFLSSHREKKAAWSRLDCHSILLDEILSPLKQEE